MAAVRDYLVKRLSKETPPTRRAPRFVVLSSNRWKNMSRTRRIVWVTGL